MGKFFNGKVRKNNGSGIKVLLIVGCIVLIVVIMLLVLSNSNKNNYDNAVLTLKESLDIEINGKKPEKLDFFTEFENYDEDLVTIDYGNFDIAKLGTYKVTVSIESGDAGEVMLNVVDTTAPTLQVKDVTLNYGNTYDAYYFVDSCSDNSLEECEIEFYQENLDQYGQTYDYSSFTEPGSYQIKIIAKDPSNNKSEVMNAILTIEGDITVEPQNCEYGSLEYDPESYNYPVAVIVGDVNNNCALDRNIWDSETAQKPAEDFFQVDYARLKNETSEILKEKYPKGAQIAIYPHKIAILNQETTGLVGYAIYVKVYVVAEDYEGEINTNENLQIAYYLNSDKTRSYEINNFNLEP